MIRGARPMKYLGRLSETEMEVMEVIWGLATSVTVNQLLDIFKSKGWKTSTLSTILKRLIEKGFLTKSMSGKVNYYDPALTLSEYKKYETQTFLSRLYNGKVKNFIAALVDDDELNQDDIAELKDWFIRKDGKK
jgi:BlaI family penicillinase repressor